MDKLICKRCRHSYPDTAPKKYWLGNKLVIKNLPTACPKCGTGKSIIERN